MKSSTVGVGDTPAFRTAKRERSRSAPRGPAPVRVLRSRSGLCSHRSGNSDSARNDDPDHPGLPAPLPRLLIFPSGRLLSVVAARDRGDAYDRTRRPSASVSARSANQVPDWMFERNQFIDLIRPVPSRPRPASTEARRIEPRTAIHSTQLRHFFDRSPTAPMSHKVFSVGKAPNTAFSVPDFFMPRARLWLMRHAFQQSRFA